MANELYVISDLGHLNNHGSNNKIIADEFFNVTNIFSANFLYKNGAKRVTFSPEMTKIRLDTFKKNFFDEFNEEPNLEKIVYGHEELMISKYCPIAKTYDTNIGCNLCYQNQYYLKDRFDDKYPLINDGFCNVKIMHSKPLNLIDYLQTIIKTGIIITWPGIIIVRINMRKRRSRPGKTILAKAKAARAFMISERNV